MNHANKKEDPRRIADRGELLFSPQFFGPAISLLIVGQSDMRRARNRRRADSILPRIETDLTMSGTDLVVPQHIKERRKPGQLAPSQTDRA